MSIKITSKTINNITYDIPTEELYKYQGNYTDIDSVLPTFSPVRVVYARHWVKIDSYSIKKL